MEAYIDHGCALLDNLIIVGEVMKESKLVLTIIGGFCPKYVSFAMH